MLQKGTLYSPANNENSVEFKKPLPNIYIYFSQNGTRKYTAKTDAKGAFSVDLALGNYQVTISQGAGFEIFPLGGGAPFELTSDSTVDAFEKWVLSPVYLKPEENPLVVLLREIAKEASDSAVKARESEEKAEKTAEDFKKDTVGDGKIMREGAYGLGVRGNRSREFDFETGVEEMGFYDAPKKAEGNPLSENGVVINLNRGTTALGNWGAMLYASDRSDNILFRRQEGEEQNGWAKILHSKNTTTDSNGFIKAASPIINLFADRIEPNNHFSQKYEKEPIFEKIDIGVYKISNTKGLAKGEYPGDWNVEIPKDINGERYFNTEWQQLEDDTVIIRTYERETFTEEYQRYDEERNVLTDPKGNPLKFYKRHEINGDPVDIKEGRFIALRFLEDKEAKAKREADYIKAQEELEEQERLRKEAEHKEG